MGDIQVGDLCLTDEGDPTVLVAATAPMVGGPAAKSPIPDVDRLLRRRHHWVTLDKPVDP